MVKLLRKVPESALSNAHEAPRRGLRVLVEQAGLFAYALALAHRRPMNTRDELLLGQRVWVLDAGTPGGKAWEPPRRPAWDRVVQRCGSFRHHLLDGGNVVLAAPRLIAACSGTSPRTSRSSCGLGSIAAAARIEDRYLQNMRAAGASFFEAMTEAAKGGQVARVPLAVEQDRLSRRARQRLS